MADRPSISPSLPRGASQEQQRLYSYRLALQSWKEERMGGYDRITGIILLLSEGDPEKLRRYKTECTHTEIAEAYLARLLNG